MGYILLLCMPGNFWLDVRHYEFGARYLYVPTTLMSITL